MSEEAASTSLSSTPPTAPDAALDKSVEETTAAPAPAPTTTESKKATTSWADDVEEEEGDVAELVNQTKMLDLDVGSAPDLHSGELIVREAGCPVDKPETKAVTSFSALDIDDSIKNAIANVKGWTTMSKIQQIGLPLILKDPPRNIIAQAQAGTGKTGTFVISMLSRITAEKKPSQPQGIILAVAQELCTQIAQEVNALGSEKGIKARRVMSARTKGAIADGSDPAAWMLNEGEDFDEQVVVGTAGMVKGYIKNSMGRKPRKPMIDPSRVCVLVLDEADQMINPRGFGGDCQFIRDAIIKKRRNEPVQVLLFSATFTEDVRLLARTFVGGNENDESKYHEITLRKADVTLEKVVNFSAMVGSGNETSDEEIYLKKYEMINEIWLNLADYNLGQTVIFCNSKKRVAHLTEYLRKENLNVGCIHGDMSKQERDTVLAEFKSGERTALVSTNVTSRGIDNPNVTLVINVDLPVTHDGQADPENFVHRIGRSGRWTRKGASVSLIARSTLVPDCHLMNDIERALFANKDVDRPLIKIEDISLIGDKLAEQLNAIK